MQARRQRRGQPGRRETPDNKVPQANPETLGGRVTMAERAKQAVKGKRAETEIRGGPATRDDKARTRRVQPENIARQILTTEKPAALETTDVPGNCRFQVHTPK